MIYILTILCQGNNNERDEKLHYIPSSLNQIYWFCHGSIMG